MDDEFIDDQKAVLKTPDPAAMPEVNLFAATNFRNQNRKFGIKLDDRRRHVYVVGKTGMGKTNLLENMALNDIYAGHGIGFVDPHGDTAEKMLDYIPANRINDVVYFNPADVDYPIGFNILEVVKPEHKHLVSSGLMSVFKKIWPDVWSPRMEYILNNTILSLLDTPGTTLLGINRMLSDSEYRDRIVSNTKDPVVKAFWEVEFASYSERFATEAVAAIQNKIGQFLSASVIRNIVAQVKSRIDIRDIMDSRKILIMNLSKGRIGEDNSRLLGGMLVNRLQLAAMERVDIPEKDRKDFFLYVDEFQNYATESFANILSEARKYRLDLTMAHQYMEQLDEHVLAAVIGNVGTMITFRVGSSDAEILAKEFVPTFVEEDLVNLPKYQIYLKLMIDGVASRPFSASTLPPIAQSTGSVEKVIRVSRERYALPKEKIEEKILRWSGMGPPGEGDAEDDVPLDPAVAKAPSSAPSRPASQERPRERQDRKPDQRSKPNSNNQVRPGNRPPQNNPSNNQLKKKPDQSQPRREERRGDDRSRINLSQTPVSTVDPSQKGISLNEAMNRPKPKVEFKPEPVKNQSESPKVRMEQAKTVEPIQNTVPQSKPVEKPVENKLVVVQQPPAPKIAEEKPQMPEKSELDLKIEEQQIIEEKIVEMTQKPISQPVSVTPVVPISAESRSNESGTAAIVPPILAESKNIEPPAAVPDNGLKKLQPGQVVQLP